MKTVTLQDQIYICYWHFSFQLRDIVKSRAKDMREEMRAKEGGKGDGGWGMSFFFTSAPLARASSRVSLFSPLEKESLLAD